MYRILFALLLIPQLVPAQEVRGPFEMLTAAYQFHDSRFAAIGPDTVEFVSFDQGNGLGYWSYSMSAESLAAGPMHISPLPQGWWSVAVGPVMLDDGWAVLEYQVLQESSFDYGYNRLLLVRGNGGEISISLLDSGRTHQYWIDSLSRKSSQIGIFPRLDGGFYTVRDLDFAMRDSSGQWSMSHERELIEYPAPDAEPISRQQPCWGTPLSGHADTVFFWSANQEESGRVTCCYSTRESSATFPDWQECVIRDYSLLYVEGSGLQLLTGYSPILQLKHLAYDGECSQIAEVNTAAEFVVAHRDFGYAFLTRSFPDLLLAQMDLDGNLIRELTPATNYLTHFRDAVMSENGEICVLWYEFSSPAVLSFSVIPWDAQLAAPDHTTPVVPNTLALSAYPNPFNSTVTIRYDLPQAANVTLAVYDLQGRKVSTLVNEFAPSGSNELHWSPDQLASGVYFLTLEAPFATTTSKLLYLK